VKLNGLPAGRQAAGEIVATSAPRRLSGASPFAYEVWRTESRCRDCAHCEPWKNSCM